MKNFLTLLIIFQSISVIAQFPTSVTVQEYAGGFERVTEITHANDERLFVCSKSGVIFIIDENGNVLSEPFLDISDSVQPFNEGGLLSLAFHPEYNLNGFFYIFYSDLDGNSQISRFTVDVNDPNKADASSEKFIFKSTKNSSLHIGGCIRFGPDGYLYISIGDGIEYGEVQKLNSFNGKLLRIDVDRGDPYTIPEDNPYVSDDEAFGEIWALGLRNPWRFSFDRANDNLWLSDVGEKDYEEINLVPASNTDTLNFGWPCYEGPDLTESFPCDNPNQSFTLSTSGYSHRNFGTCTGSITGGYVYRGQAEKLNNFGAYISADFCSGIIHATYQENGQYTTEKIYQTDLGISTIGENVDGELLIADYYSGRIFELNFNCKLPDVLITSVSCPTFNDGGIEISIPENENILGVELRDSLDNLIDPLTYGNLSEGSYFLRSNNSDTECTVDIPIDISSFDPFIRILRATDCFTPDGCIELFSDQNFNENFSFRLENEDGQVVDSSDYCNLFPGTYSLISGNGNIDCDNSDVLIVGHRSFLRLSFQNGIISVTDTFATYQWFFDRDTIIGANEASHIPTLTGSYSLSTTNINGCHYNSNTITVEISTSVSGSDQQSTFTITPNPATYYLTVNYSIKNKGAIEVSILSTQGELVYNKSISGINLKINEQIDIDHIPTGAYILRIIDGENEVSEKFVKY